MKLGYLGRRPFLIGIVLLYLFSLCSVAGEGGEEVVWIEGRIFDVIGTDNRSVSFANVLGDHVAEMCRRYLKAGSHDFPNRILVTLWPEGRMEFEGPYRIGISPRGQIGLNLCWNESLNFEVTCRAFTEAYLLHYARFNYGVGAEKRIRFWAVSALVLRNYLSLRPAQMANYVHEARQSEMLEIESLLSLYLSKVTAENMNFHQGYWMFQILRESGLKNSQVVALLERAIAGENVETRIAKMLFPEDKEQASARLEEWWQNQINNYLAQEREFCDSLEISKLWIQEMANFDAYDGSGEKLKNLMGLWNHRYNEELRSILSARCEIIRLRMEQVNPAYFNAALSLGALYETVLDAEHKHEFIRSVTVYLNDWEDTKQLHARTDELMLVCD